MKKTAAWELNPKQPFFSQRKRKVGFTADFPFLRFRIKIELKGEMNRFFAVPWKTGMRVDRKRTACYTEKEQMFENTKRVGGKYGKKSENGICLSGVRL